jgi:hypothetical protein
MDGHAGAIIECDVFMPDDRYGVKDYFPRIEIFLYLPVYRAPVPCLDDQNHKPAVLKIADDAIVANAASPELPQFRALQCLPHLAGVIEIGNAAFEEVS